MQLLSVPANGIFLILFCGDSGKTALVSVLFYQKNKFYKAALVYLKKVFIAELELYLTVSHKE